MPIKERFRHELKYQIDYGRYLAVRQRVRTVMKLDPHAQTEGSYRIRSIYFDNLDDKALREKTDGVDQRKKFRIRYYNDDFSFITLEKKIKHGGLCKKLDARVSLEEVQKLLKGDRAWMMLREDPLVRELYVRMKTEGLKPRVLVSYEREPYVFPAGNVRVTFDSNIRTSLNHQSFLEPQVWDISAEEQKGQVVLEVKYDDFLPEVISHLIQTEGIRQQAFSKYGACRRYG